MIDPKLTTFLAAGKLRNFTRAAEMLNLTQPAVTQHIKALESYYGVKLFEKTGRQVRLTGEGEILYRYAKTAERYSLMIERKLKNKAAIIKRYDMGATLTIGEYVLPHVLGEYKRSYPNIDVIMQVANTEVIVDKLASGEIDLALVEGPFDRSRFRYKKLKDDELVLAVSSGSSLTKKKYAELDEILNGRLILREQGSGTRKVFENKLFELGYDLGDYKTYMEIGSINAIKSLVQSNLGYTIISREAIKSELKQGTIISIPIRNVTILREFNFIYTNHAPAEFVESFISFTGANIT